MKGISLTPEERKELLRLDKQITDKKASMRIRVILALDLGYGVKQVADLFLIDEDTVGKWRNKYQKRQFLSDWLGEGYAGYKGKLTKEQEENVVKFVEKNVITDCKEVLDFIQRKFGLQYTITGVTKLLHRMGFVYKQIVAIPGKLDEKKQQEFLKEYETLKAIKKEDEIILFGDGVHPAHNIHKTKAWVKRGEDKQVKTNTGRDRLNINGVLDPETLTVTTYFSKTINAQTTSAFFDMVQERYKEKKKITIVVDNARYYKNKEVTAYLAKPECRIELLFLPPYSPNLNFIERLWKFLKKEIIGVKYREKFKQFEDEIHQFFDNITQYEEKLRPFIGTRLHLVKLTA